MLKQFIVRLESMLISFVLCGTLLVGCGNANVQDTSVSTAMTEETDIDENQEAEEEAKRAEEEAKKAEEEAKKAEEEAKKAEEEAKKAEEEARRAEENAKAEEERKKAEEERIKAEEERKRAEEERIEAEEAAQKAEEEAKRAEEERKKAEEERKRAEEAAKIEENTLTDTQLVSITMLNYMTVVTQKINYSHGNQLYLESVRNNLHNETILKAVDTKTQAQINKLVGLINDYSMVDEKRKRLEFIYEQNRAQALRKAIPNPVGLLSVVQSGSLLKAAASIVYMAVDSASSYEAATNQAEMQFIQAGWELDDAERKVLQDSTTAQFDYMCNMVRAYDIPDEYVVRDTDVSKFVEWAREDNLDSKIYWLENNESKYQKFGPYWLQLVKDYYEQGEKKPKYYSKCLKAISEYENVTAKITRQDCDYASALPMVIIAAREALPKDQYIKTARDYCTKIIENTKDEDWALRYFAAQIYLDLYKQSNSSADLKSAYDIALYNVNNLVKEQRILNEAYKEIIVDIKPDKDATKRKKEEIKQYNKLRKEERKIAAPPVSEALYLNCDLLFALADKRGISKEERNSIENILHGKNEDLFLSKVVDNRFRINADNLLMDSKNIEIKFDGDKLIVPASCITDRAKVTISISGSTSEIIDDLIITEVERPKNASSCSDYIVKMKSNKAKLHKYVPGEKITITIMPVEEVEPTNNIIEFKYNVVATKKAFVVNGITFERK